MSPVLDVRLLPVGAPNPDGTVDEIELLGGARLCVNADASRATFHATPRPDSVDLVHPWLAPAAARRSLALGRLTLHGGLVLCPEGAVAVVGDREAGKSTLMAHAALAGMDVMSDDIIVWDQGVVYAGPRCVDLRPGAAAYVGPERLHMARGGTRHRLQLRPVSWDARLLGVVVLAWGDGLECVRIGPGRRLAEMESHLACASTSVARMALLSMAETPVWRLTRPYDFALLDATLALALATAAGEERVTA